MTLDLSLFYCSASGLLSTFTNLQLDAEDFVRCGYHLCVVVHILHVFLNGVGIVRRMHASIGHCKKRAIVCRYIVPPFRQIVLNPIKPHLSVLISSWKRYTWQDFCEWSDLYWFRFTALPSLQDWWVFVAQLSISYLSLWIWVHPYCIEPLWMTQKHCVNQLIRQLVWGGVIARQDLPFLLMVTIRMSITKSN